MTDNNSANTPGDSPEAKKVDPFLKDEGKTLNPFDMLRLSVKRTQTRIKALVAPGAVNQPAPPATPPPQTTPAVNVNPNHQSAGAVQTNLPAMQPPVPGPTSALGNAQLPQAAPMAPMAPNAPFNPGAAPPQMPAARAGTATPFSVGPAVPGSAGAPGGSSGLPRRRQPANPTPLDQFRQSLKRTQTKIQAMFAPGTQPAAPSNQPAPSPPEPEAKPKHNDAVEQALANLDFGLSGAVEALNKSQAAALSKPTPEPPQQEESREEQSQSLFNIPKPDATGTEHRPVNAGPRFASLDAMPGQQPNASDPLRNLFKSEHTPDAPSAPPAEPTPAPPMEPPVAPLAQGISAIDSVLKRRAQTHEQPQLHPGPSPAFEASSQGIPKPPGAPGQGATSPSGNFGARVDRPSVELPSEWQTGQSQSSFANRFDADKGAANPTPPHLVPPDSPPKPAPFSQGFPNNPFEEPASDFASPTQGSASSSQEFSSFAQPAEPKVFGADEPNMSSFTQGGAPSSFGSVNQGGTDFNSPNQGGAPSSFGSMNQGGTDFNSPNQGGAPGSFGSFDQDAMLGSFDQGQASPDFGSSSHPQKQPAPAYNPFAQGGANPFAEPAAQNPFAEPSGQNPFAPEAEPLEQNRLFPKSEAPPEVPPTVDHDELSRFAESERARAGRRLSDMAAAEGFEPEATPAPGRTRPSSVIRGGRDMAGPPSDILQKVLFAVIGIVVVAGLGFAGWQYYQAYQSKSLVDEGIKLNAAGKNKEALASFDQAVSLNKKNSAAYCGRGIAYSNQKDFRRALQDFNTAMMMQPNNLDYVSFRAPTALAAGEYAMALQDYNTLIAQLAAKDKTPDLYVSRASIEVKLGQFQQALSDYRVALKSDPKNKKLLAAAAFCEHKQNKPAK